MNASDAAQRRADLVASLDDPNASAKYEPLTPLPANRYVLRPVTSAHASYGEWPTIDSLLRVAPLPGLLEKRGGGLIDFDRKKLKARIKAYLDKSSTFEDARGANPALATNRAGYDAKKVRFRFVTEGFQPGNVQRYAYFAFDLTHIRPSKRPFEIAYVHSCFMFCRTQGAFCS